MIQRVEVFETKGLQFGSLKKAVDYREGLVETFFRNTPGFFELQHSTRIKFIQRILEDRKELIGLLDYDVPDED